MSFFEALQSAGPASDRADKMGLYGWLAGDWTMEGTVHAADGSRHEVQGHIHAGWVLEGRAIQDVWILPGFFHGTTLRVYDPNLDAWHILWSDPLKQYFARQIGRAQGADIVQEGRNEAGEAIRWRFTDITENSFCWLGERSLDDGATWQLQARFLARRTVVPAVKPMLDHVSIGVSDIAAAKRFYDGVLQPLGYRCLYRGPGDAGVWGHRARRCGSTGWRVPCRRMRHPGCISASPRRLGRGSMHFMRRRFDRAGGTTGSRGCVSITVRNITQRSWLIPTATGSRRIMVGRRAIIAQSVMHFTSRSPRNHYG